MTASALVLVGLDQDELVSSMSVSVSMSNWYGHAGPKEFLKNPKKEENKKWKESKNVKNKLFKW